MVGRLNGLGTASLLNLFDVKARLMLFYVMILCSFKTKGFLLFCDKFLAYFKPTMFENSFKRRRNKYCF